MRLEELVGQEQAVRVLVRAIATARVPHAYLFEGPTGIGKRNAAIGLAMALNCEQRSGAAGRDGDGDGGAACGACDACRRIASGLHPDVLTFAPDGPQIVMEQAQEMVALGQRRPHEGRARVIIVDDADRLNANASNCLLKTLEEPSPGTHLVLVTAAPDRLLGTIRSRTQRVRFRSVSVETLLALGTRRGIAAEQSQVAAIVADGCVARFIELGTSTEDVGPRQATAALRQAARARGIGPILDTASELGDKESKQRLPEALALLARVYRDALVEVVGAPELAVLAVAAPGANDDGGDPLAPPTDLSVAALGRALSAIVEADAALVGNVNAVMAVERLLLNLRREERAAA
ncbi:MAG: DNA polymerase III subunit delta' [Haliangium ochraceum]